MVYHDEKKDERRAEKRAGRNGAHMGNRSESGRSSNIELLRVVGMLMIVLYHIVYHAVGFQLTDTDSIAKWGNAWFCEPAFYKLMLLPVSVIPFGTVGNGLFIMISGYFLVAKGGGVDLGKTAKKLLLQLGFASLVLLVVPTLWYWAGETEFTSFTQIQTMNDASWFVGYYFALAVIGALFLNRYLLGLERGRYRAFLLVFLAFAQFTWIGGTLLGGLSGGLRDLCTGLFLYALGGYIRLYAPFERIRAGAVLLLMLLTYALIALSYYNYTQAKVLALPEGTDFFLQYYSMYANYSPSSLVLAVSLFELFRRLRLPSSRFVNFLGRATFMVYLIHDNPLFYSLWETQDWVTTLHDAPAYFMVKLLLWAMGAFAVGTAAYLLYLALGRLLRRYKGLFLKKA